MHSTQTLEALFDTPCEGVLTDAAVETLRHANVCRYRVKTIKSGGMLEVEVFPLLNSNREIRRAKSKITREVQRRLNDRNARKRLNRKLNTNFTCMDLHVTLTYAGEDVPGLDQAQRDIKNYIKRIRHYRRKMGMSELKYVYVIEFDEGDGERRKKRVHHHVIMSGMNRDEAEKIWGKGRANADRLKPDAYGLEALTRYITKAPRGGKRWSCSRNLKEPTITTADTKLSRRQVERLAAEATEYAPILLCSKYPGYEFLDHDVMTSRYVPGAYVYARMHRATVPPYERGVQRHG